MKRILLIALALVLSAPVAVAAPKAIAPGLGSIFTAPIGSEAMVLSGNNTIFLANQSNSTADIEIMALDQGQNKVWSRVIDSGVDEVATAIATDPLGNIWLAGSSASLVSGESPTATTGIDNPDNVVLDGDAFLRTDMTNVGLWKLSAAGDLLATYQQSMPSIPVISSISVIHSGLSIVGSVDGKPFLLTASTSGIFGKVIYFGSSKSEFNVVARNPDGSSTIFGSSAETLAGKKVAGKRDGLLLKVSKTGAITSLVRSSANGAARSWVSGDNVNLTSGPVIVGKSTETAITKFNAKFAPTWNLRVSSTGASQSLSANGNSYLAVTSRAPIAGVLKWKPVKPALIVLTFDSKGVLKAATALPGLVKPLSLQYSQSRGVIGLAAASDGTVSIFTLVSR
ncbi:MAG: hypothetical protein RLZZ277_470 [Actinomycetota bacterium]|jgi:hypothetical protein